MKRLLNITILLLLLVGCEPDVIEPDPLPEVDTTPPVITLNGNEVSIIEIGDELPDFSATATDNWDVAHLYQSGLEMVNPNKLGTYHIYYNAFDYSGNVAEEVMQTVHIIPKVPGMIVSFNYSHYESIGISLMMIDIDNTLLTLNFSLYDEDELITTIPYEDGMTSFVIDELTPNIRYELRIEGTYDSLIGLDPIPFSMEPLSVGTYRILDESYRDLVGDDEVFAALQRTLYLPFDTSNDSKIRELVPHLANIPVEYLDMVNTSNVAMILVNNNVTDVLEYHNDPLYQDYAIIYGFPIVFRIGYQGTSVNALLQYIGITIAEFYLPGIPYSSYWNDIYEAEAHLMFPTSQYGTDPHMYFVEAFAYYYFNESSNEQLEALAPLTHGFIKDLQDIYNGELYPDWNETLE